jgi:hypothetical protein
MAVTWTETAPGVWQYESTAGENDAVPVSWRMSNRREDIVTQVIIGRETDDVPVTYESGAGQELYGVETWEATDLVCTSTSQLQRLALRLLRTRGYATSPRVDGVLLDAATGDLAATMMQIVTPFVPTRIRCRLELERGVISDRSMFVTGVTHRMTPGQWQADINLDVSSPWVSSAGRWEEASWDQSNWSA